MLFGSNPGVNRATFLLEALRENLFPGPFRLLEAICTPWLVAASSVFKASSVASSDMSLTLTSALL